MRSNLVDIRKEKLCAIRLDSLGITEKLTKNVISIESWVEVNGSQVMGTPVHLLTRSGTHSFRSLERLLTEAQKESNQSSMGGSARNSHSISPKSAPSPVFPAESLSPNESIFLCKVCLSFTVLSIN